MNSATVFISLLFWGWLWACGNAAQDSDHRHCQSRVAARGAVAPDGRMAGRLAVLGREVVGYNKGGVAR